MTKQVYQQTIVDNSTGLPVENAELEIRYEANGQLALTWTDRAGEILGDNPVHANENGFVQIYLDPGRYKMTASAPGLSSDPLRDHLIFPETLVDVNDINQIVIDAAAYRDEANEWANADEDEPVGGSPGLFSSYHWATKAEKWAEEDEDVPVEEGPDRFSAKHWALKAEANALAEADVADAFEAAPELDELLDDHKFGAAVPESPSTLQGVPWELIKDTIDNRFKDWCSASLVGSGLAISSVTVPALAAMNSTRVAFIDQNVESLRAYDWNGSTWSLVGTGLSITGISSPSLAALNSTDVAFIDQTIGELRCYRFNGSIWSLVGTGLTIAGLANGSALAALNSTDVAIIDSTVEELRVYRFNGSTWAQVGNSLSIAGIGTPALAALNGTDVAFIDATLEALRTYRFDGTNWSLVGSGLSIAGIGTPALAALNGTDVAFIDATLDSMRIYRFNGSTWAQTGHSVSISGIGVPALAALNGTDLAFIDDTNDELQTYRWTKKLGTHGSYTGTLTGLTTSPTVTINYSIVGDVVTLTSGANAQGTSNANTFTITGAPAIITPTVGDCGGFCLLVDNGAGASGAVRMTSAGVLAFLLGGSLTGFTASGTKGLPGSRLCYTFKLTNPS